VEHRGYFGHASFFRALPQFPVEGTNLHILVSRASSASASPEALSALKALDTRTASGDDVDRSDLCELRIPVTPANMDVVADIYPTFRCGGMLRWCFVQQGEKVVMIIGNRETDVIAGLSTEQMRTFCKPLGITFRRQRYNGVVNFLISVVMTIWTAVTRRSAYRS